MILHVTDASTSRQHNDIPDFDHQQEHLNMKTAKRLLTALLLVVVILPAKAQSDMSTLSAMSVMPIASIASVASVAAAGSVVVPAILLTAGSVLVVKAVEASTKGTVLVLETLSDGTRVVLEIAGTGLAASALGAGALLTVSVIGAGTILSTAGEVIAFIPSAIGNALLYNQRITN
jgi:hypothetical protein